MVNVIDNGARNRANMMPVGIKIVDNKGNTTYTAKTDLGTNYISLQSEWFGSSSNNTGGSTGGNTGGNSDHPNVGADYYPGSVYDGTVSGRTLLYSGVTSTTDKTNIVLPESVGTGLRLLGDGIQYRVSMDKTLITRGVKGDTTNIPLVYDVKDQKMAGSYVTVSPLPVSNRKNDLISGSELVTPFNGIGEGDGSAEIKAPEIHVQYDSKTNSINVWGVQGYALDNLSDTKTGTLYDVKITLMNSFYVQNPVAQLPADMNLFTGDIDGEVDLTGVPGNFDNVGDGIEVEIEPYLYFVDPNLQGNPESRASIIPFNLPNKIEISKEDLILNNNVNIPGSVPSSLSSLGIESWINNSWFGGSDHSSNCTITVENQAILIGSKSINVTLNIIVNYQWNGSASKPINCYAKVLNVKTIKAGE